MTSRMRGGKPGFVVKARTATRAGKPRHERLITMTVSDHTVAIIGTCNIGGRLAANFAAGGQDFLLADRDQDTARKAAADLDGHAEAVTIDAAVDRADVLVVALWLDALE